MVFLFLLGHFMCAWGWDHDCCPGNIGDRLAGWRLNKKVHCTSRILWPPQIQTKDFRPSILPWRQQWGSHWGFWVPWGWDHDCCPGNTGDTLAGGCWIRKSIVLVLLELFDHQRYRPKISDLLYCPVWCWHWPQGSNWVYLSPWWRQNAHGNEH